MFDLPESITVWNIVSDDGHGIITWSAPATYAARIAFRDEKITDKNGDQVMSTSVAYSEGSTLGINSQVYFGTSAELEPIAAANDVRKLSKIPSATDMRKVWFV